MAGSTFGNQFKITTWGESHGKAVGVVIDGCPAGLALTESDIQYYLNHHMCHGSHCNQRAKKIRCVCCNTTKGRGCR